MAHREGLTNHPRDWSMVKASSLINDQKVITIDGSLPVEEACKILIDNNISSAPVQDSSSTRTTPNYVGMFDYGDLIAYLLLVFLDRVPGQQPPSESIEIRDIVRTALEGKTVPVSMASDLSQKNPFYSILPEATLISAIEEFACGTHRVSVLEPSGQIKGILSQSTVVRYLYENRKNFPDIEALLNKTLRQLKLGESNVIGVSGDARVMEALSLMSQHGVSSLAVFGHSGTVQGNISMTDIKHVMKGARVQLLWTSCLQFVNMVRSEQGISDGQDRIPVFDVHLDTTLGFAIAKLLATKSHRVWVTDERGRAIGVVSLTDITRVFANAAGLETAAQPRRTSFVARK